MKILPRFFLSAALLAGIATYGTPVTFAADDAPAVAESPPSMPAATDAVTPTSDYATTNAPAISTPSLSPATPPSHATSTKHSTSRKTHTSSRKSSHKKHKAKKKKTTKHKKRHKKLSSSNYEIREAQIHLIHLGYYKGSADGIIGPKTRTALKAFQRDHRLPVTGKLTATTRILLHDLDRSQMDMSSFPPSDFYEKHPDYYGSYDQQYSDPLQLARARSGDLSQTLPNRFADLSVTEVPSDSLKHYDVTLNGQPILTVNNQPSVIGISKTFNLGDEDVIIFSTYNYNNATCTYKSYLLTLHQGANELRPIENCTRRYIAEIKEDSLVIVFPETDDDRAVGATYRYEAGGSLEKL